MATVAMVTIPVATITTATVAMITLQVEISQNKFWMVHITIGLVIEINNIKADMPI